MCIDIDGHYTGGSSFIYVNDFCYYRNCLYTQRYKFSSEKKKTGKESLYIVSRPEPGSDPPFGSDRELGCDSSTVQVREKQLRGRMGGVLVMKGEGRVNSIVQVGEKQLGGRTGGVLVMKGAV